MTKPRDRTSDADPPDRKDESGENPDDDALQRMVSLTRRVVGVPKSEIECKKTNGGPPL